MHCEQSEALLTKFVFDELDEASRRDVAAHLEACEACRAVMGDLRVAARLLKEGVEAGAPPKLNPARRASILKAPSRPPRPKTTNQKPQTKRTPIISNRDIAVAAGFMLAAVGGAALLFPTISKARSTQIFAMSSSGTPGLDRRAAAPESAGSGWSQYGDVEGDGDVLAADGRTRTASTRPGTDTIAYNGVAGPPVARRVGAGSSPRLDSRGLEAPPTPESAPTAAEVVVAKKNFFDITRVTPAVPAAPAPQSGGGGGGGGVSTYDWLALSGTSSEGPGHTSEAEVIVRADGSVVQKDTGRAVEGLAQLQTTNPKPETQSAVAAHRRAGYYAFPDATAQSRGTEALLTAGSPAPPPQSAVGDTAGLSLIKSREVLEYAWRPPAPGAAPAAPAVPPPSAALPAGPPAGYQNGGFGYGETAKAAPAPAAEAALPPPNFDIAQEGIFRDNTRPIVDARRSGVHTATPAPHPGQPGPGAAQVTTPGGIVNLNPTAPVTVAGGLILPEAAAPPGKPAYAFTPEDEADAVHGPPDERMRITNGGNLGIGKTASGAKLDAASTLGLGAEGPGGAGHLSRPDDRGPLDSARGTRETAPTPPAATATADPHGPVIAALTEKPGIDDVTGGFKFSPIAGEKSAAPAAPPPPAEAKPAPRIALANERAGEWDEAIRKPQLAEQPVLRLGETMEQLKAQTRAVEGPGPVPPAPGRGDPPGRPYAGLPPAAPSRAIEFDENTTTFSFALDPKFPAKPEVPNSSEPATKLPLPGDVPVAGNLFKEDRPAAAQPQTTNQKPQTVILFPEAKAADHGESADGEDYHQSKGDSKNFLSYIPGQDGGFRGSQPGANKVPGVYDTLGVGQGAAGAPVYDGRRRDPIDVAKAPAAPRVGGASGPDTRASRPVVAPTPAPAVAATPSQDADKPREVAGEKEGEKLNLKFGTVKYRVQKGALKTDMEISTPNSTTTVAGTMGGRESFAEDKKEGRPDAGPAAARDQEKWEVHKRMVAARVTEAPPAAPAAPAPGTPPPAPPTVVDFNDRTSRNEAGFLSNEFPARAEDFDKRFRSIGSFLGNGDRLANRGGLGPEGEIRTLETMKKHLQDRLNTMTEGAGQSDEASRKTKKMLDGVERALAGHRELMALPESARAGRSVDVEKLFDDAGIDLRGVDILGLQDVAPQPGGAGLRAHPDGPGDSGKAPRLQLGGEFTREEARALAEEMLGKLTAVGAQHAAPLPEGGLAGAKVEARSSRADEQGQPDSAAKGTPGAGAAPADGAEKSSAESYLHLHDVRDLLTKISDNPGPTIELRPPEGRPSWSPGQAAGPGGDKPRPSTALAGATLTDEQIVQLVKENVRPETWDQGDHSLTITPNQQLLINGPREVQQEVRDFLGKLREHAGSMTGIEARSVAGDDKFLEKIGLDIRGLQDVGAAQARVGGASTPRPPVGRGVDTAPTPRAPAPAPGTDGRADQLMEMAKRQFEQGRYDESIGTVDQLLHLNPDMKDAYELRRIARRADHAKAQNQSLDQHVEQWKRVFKSIDRHAALQSRIVEFPDRDTWERIKRREPRGITSLEESVSPEDEAAYAALEKKKVTLDGQDRPLSEVIEELRKTTQATFVVDPDVAAANAPVTLRVQNLPLQSTLNLALGAHGLGYAVEDGVIKILPQDKLKKRTKLELYDVQDLTAQITEFPGPDISPVLQAQPGGAGHPSRPETLASASTAAASPPAGDRVFTRPPTYAKTLGFPTGGKPVDLTDMIRRHPELDGIVMLAPTYNDVLEREGTAKRARGETPVPDYRLAPGAAFSIDVAGEPSLSRTYTVGSHGYVDVPLVGEVVVANKTAKEVREEVTLKLRKFYADPKVAVNPVSIANIGGYAGRPRAGSIAVVGPGGGAGNVAYTGDETVMKLLASQGLGPDADLRQVRILQRADPARGRPRGRIVVVDATAFAFGDFKQDFPLQPDDVVIIPSNSKSGGWEQLDAGWGHMLKFLQGPTTKDTPDAQPQTPNQKPQTPPEPQPIIPSQALVDLIKSNIAKDTWDQPGNSLDFNNGLLIVKNSPEVQRKVQKFLSEVRESTGLLANAGSRFMRVQDNFSEEVGVDFKDVDTAAAPLASDIFAPGGSGVPAATPQTSRVGGAEAPPLQKEEAGLQAGPPEGRGQKAVPTAPYVRLTPEEAAKNEMAQGRGRKAAAALEKALALKREFKFAGALQTAREALAADPQNTEARALETELAGLLGEHTEKATAISDLTREQLLVRAQQLEPEIDNHVEKGKRYLADQQYTEALREFETAQETLKAIPYEDLPIKTRLPEVERMIRKTKDDQAETQRLVEAENREKPIDEAHKEEARRRREVKLTVRDLLRKSVENFEQGRYERSAELADAILLVDSHYKAAVDLRDHALKARQKKEYADYLTTRIAEWKKVTDEESEVMIPYSETLRFPDAQTWRTISRRLAPVAAESDRAPDAAAIQNKLDNLKIEIDFQEAGLQDVLEFVHTFSNINIDVDPAVLKDPAIMDKKISFKVKDRPLAEVLKLVLSRYDLGYTVADKAVAIAKPAAADRGRETAPTQDDALPSEASFPNYPVNPFVMTAQEAFSTFGLDTDTASYSLARNYIRKGYLPPAGAVRMEEFVNAFDYNYPCHAPVPGVGRGDPRGRPDESSSPAAAAGRAQGPPLQPTFAIHVDAAPSPFRPGLTLLKIGVQGKAIGREGRKPAHLVFVVDTSGSMARPDRMPLVQQSLALLVGQLGPRDRVSLVTYGTHARLALEAAGVGGASSVGGATGPDSRGSRAELAPTREAASASPQQILDTLRSIACGGSTNLVEGLEAGYDLARRHFRAGEINRVILCSDGVANVGLTDADAILKKVEAARGQGIAFTSAGFGMGAYNDALLQKLADKGDGNYLFIDSPDEARRAFVDQFAATLQTIAKDAKIQVEFNPARVRRYRMIGYEKRALKKEDFRNDAVDAGEIGSGQAATALYEVELAEEPGATAWEGPSGPDQRGVAGRSPLPPATADLGTVYVRYRDVDTGKVEEIARRLAGGSVRRLTPQAAPRFFLAACAAEFAELLRESEYAKDGNFERVQRVLEQAAAQLPLDQKVQELLELVKKSQGLPRAR